MLDKAYQRYVLKPPPKKPDTRTQDNKNNDLGDGKPDTWKNDVSSFDDRNPLKDKESVDVSSKSPLKDDWRTARSFEI